MKLLVTAAIIFVSLTASALGALPPGYEDKLLCPCNYCQIPFSTNTGFGGPKSMFRRCQNSRGDLKAVTVWGSKTGRSLDVWKKAGYHELECSSSTLTSYACKTGEGASDKCQNDCELDEWGEIQFRKLPEEFKFPSYSKSDEIKMQLKQDKQSLKFEFELELESCVQPGNVQVAVHKAILPDSILGKKCQGVSPAAKPCYPAKVCDERTEIVSTTQSSKHAKYKYSEAQIAFREKISHPGAARVAGSFKYTDDDKRLNAKLEKLWLKEEHEDTIFFCLRVEVTRCGSDFLVLQKEKLVSVQIQRNVTQKYRFKGIHKVGKSDFTGDIIEEVVADDVEEIIDFEIFPCTSVGQAGFYEHPCWVPLDSEIRSNQPFTLCIGSEKHFKDYKIDTIEVEIPSDCSVCAGRGDECLEPQHPKHDTKFQIYSNKGPQNDEYAMISPNHPTASKCIRYDYFGRDGYCEGYFNVRREGYYLNVRLHQRFFLDCDIQFTGTVTATRKPDACKNTVCTQDICPDGKSRRRIGNECCACPPDACKNAVCQQDICLDDKPRRRIGNECCACPPGPWRLINSDGECDVDAGEKYLEKSSPGKNTGKKHLGLEECKKKCVDVTACQSITYFDASGWCSLFSTPCTATKRRINSKAVSYRYIRRAPKKKKKSSIKKPGNKPDKDKPPAYNKPPTQPSRHQRSRQF